MRCEVPAMSNTDSLRRIALSLPEAYEQDHFGGPSFRVAKKIFASCSPEKNRATLKLDRDQQMILFEVRPETFSPAVWGALVWTYVELGRIDDDELEDLLKRAWRQVAPEALVKNTPHSRTPV
jgi:hypothetical protein